MSYTVFARKYRPQTFADVVGQEHITTTLQNAIQQQRLAHAYIFVGPRGTGKTSTARILAKALNCVQGPTITPCNQCDVCREIAAGTSLDVLEFDAASNTQVDKIREIIIENVRYAPTRGKYKLYIVDEVHMLSNSSFNALLKTLEEPPAHVKFVFATTDVQKVPTTILSRCQRFDLKRIPAQLISSHLLSIATKESIQLSNAAADSLARGAEGGMRDAESMLDQLVAFCGNHIEENDVLQIFGFTARETVSSLCEHLIAGQIPEALHLLQQQAEAGKDLSRLFGDLITHLRNLLVAKADPKGLSADLGPETVAALLQQGERLEMTRLLELIEQFAEAESRIKWAPDKKMHFEIALIRASQTLQQATLTEVLQALSAMAQGQPVQSRTATKPSLKPEPKPAAPSPKPTAAPAPKPSAPQPASTQAPPWDPAPNTAATASPAPAAPAIPPSTPAPEPTKKTKPSAVTTPKAEPAPAPVSAKEITPEPQPATAPLADSTDAAALWKALLAEVQKQRPLIAAWVRVGTLLELHADTALIGFPPDESLSLEYCEQPNNRTLLENLIQTLLGRPVRIKMALKEGLASAPAPEPERPRDPMEEFKNDPLIRKALEIFKTEIHPA